MLNLIRFKTTEDGIFGKMYLGGVFVCYTLENKKLAAPCGYFRLENSTSPKFKRELPLFYNDDMPASRGFRIHVGNKPEDSNGCILVGMGISGRKLVESKKAEDMMTMICRNTFQMVVSEV